jgi:hypothetical protein
MYTVHVLSYISVHLLPEVAVSDGAIRWCEGGRARSVIAKTRCDIRMHGVNSSSLTRPASVAAHSHRILLCAKRAGYNRRQLRDSVSRVPRCRYDRHQRLTAADTEHGACNCMVVD